MIRLGFIIALFFSLPFISWSQSPEHELANLYYTTGEYDKALGYYEKFYNETQDFLYLQRYVDCLVKSNNGKTAEKVLQKHIKKNPNDYLIAVYLGRIFEEDNRNEEALKHYQKLIDDLPNNANSVLALSKVFRDYRMFNWELETLLKGRKMLKDKYPFNTQLAEVYGALNQNDKMIDEYIGYLDISANYKNTVQNLLSRYLSFDDEEDEVYNIMKERLLERVQKNPNNALYSELLVWLYTHKGNYKAAIIQAKALDKRENRAGRDVMNIGVAAKNFGDYKTARSAFQYVLDLGQGTPNYLRAEKELLNTLFIEITNERSFTSEEIEQAETAYRQAIERVGKSKNTYRMMMELAEILAFYGDKAQIAKDVTNDILTIQQLPVLAKAEAKMLQADIEVLLGNIWEASLLYMQVEKDFKYDAIGAEAKFKTARIFYFSGAFEFAQSQLDVLKGSTSKLISNDAMHLSVIITDNLGIDSNYQAMEQFSRGDLFLAQHKYSMAFEVYDSIITAFPYHSLVDEIYMRKANAMQMQGKWQDAVVYLEKIVADHGEDILADDALMQLGEIYEKRLHDKEKAIDYYKRILFDYKGSLHVVEARKRYRILTGDAPVEMVIPN